MLRFAPVRFASVRVFCCVELELALEFCGSAGIRWFLLVSAGWFCGVVLRSGSARCFCGRFLGAEGGRERVRGGGGGECVCVCVCV